MQCSCRLMEVKMVLFLLERRGIKEAGLFRDAIDRM